MSSAQMQLSCSSGSFSYIHFDIKIREPPWIRRCGYLMTEQFIVMLRDKKTEQMMNDLSFSFHLPRLVFNCSFSQSVSEIHRLIRLLVYHVPFYLEYRYSSVRSFPDFDIITFFENMMYYYEHITVIG